MPTSGGNPLAVTTGGSGRVEQRAAVPVAVVSGQAPVAGRARRVQVVTSGPVEGGQPIPVYDAGASALYTDEPALPVYVVSGSLGGGAAPVFSPADIAGLQLWLKADAGAGTNDGDAIASWTDQSGNTKHATQATGTKRPTYKTNIQNGKPVARFDGGDALVTPSITLGAFTVCVVFSASANGFIYEQSATANSNNGSYLYTDITQTSQIYRAAVQSGKSRAANWGIGSTWRVVTQRFGGTHATNQLWINGTLQTMSDGSFTSDPGTTPISDVINIGSRNQAGVFLTGDIAEILIYNSALSSTDRSAVETYLQAKYAL